ncbi:hypothetical protein [Uliginosibacterium aquaticum]|uniref:DUF2726 domain-containing protein n=1 Tax=Uliginosibacterium aquaticum TaxID=2731212 RepID=A0ABX2ICH3_9RHOO|nr:hypothetical protein [Uliginosibacterium aquaticum]NSL54230.1 hypothetical protein [Uliginosibacterium aquaticum]
MLVYGLILTVFFGVMAFFLYRAWRVWQQRFGQRDNDFDAYQLQQLVKEAEAGNPLPNHETFEIKPLPVTPAAAVVDTTPRTRRPLLDGPAQDAFLLLHADVAAGFPLLASVDIATLLDAHGTPPPRVSADFVICKKDFSPAVVIFIERSPGDPMIERAQTLLRSHRLRVLRWPASSLPSREEMRRQVFKPRAAA